MTKYEWEKELRKNIHRVPDEEKKRVFEYYNELFADKKERGSEERKIIMEFGNPVDVADKILTEYYSANSNMGNEQKASEDFIIKGAVKLSGNKTEAKYAPERFIEEPSGKSKQAAHKKHKTKADKPVRSGTSFGRVVLFIMVAIVFGGFYIGLVISLWAIVVALFVSGVASIIAGLVYVVPTIMMWSSGVYPALVQLGVCLLVVGVGFLAIVIGKIAGKVSKFLTITLGGLFKRVLVLKEVTYEK